MVKKWHEKLKSEHITWLTQQLLDGRYPVEEICRLFTYKFPDIAVDFVSRDLILYARNNITGWKQSSMATTISEEVEKQISKVDFSEDLLNEEDEKKINAIKVHRRLLAEHWKNYRALIDNNSLNETAKINYLSNCSREVVLLLDLEVTEKSIVAMLGEVKKKEKEESAEQLTSYIGGYSFPKLWEKAKSLEHLQKLIGKLKSQLDILVETVVKVGNVEDVKNEVTKVYLRQVYEPHLSQSDETKTVS